VKVDTRPNLSPGDFVKDIRKDEDGLVWVVGEAKTTVSGYQLLCLKRTNKKDRWVAWGTDTHRNLRLATDAEILADRLVGK
jgi:hypothetical protein